MAKVEIAVIPENDPVAVEVQSKIHSARAEVEEHAYRVAQDEGNNGRSDFENWLLAESQIYWVPSCELVESNGAYRLRFAVPGLEARQVKLTVLSESIVITADGSGQEAPEGTVVHLCEFNHNPVLRCMDLPGKIDVGAVKAKLERGILEVTAPKRSAKPARTKPAEKAKPQAKSARAAAKPRASKRAR